MNRDQLSLFNDWSILWLIRVTKRYGMGQRSTNQPTYENKCYPYKVILYSYSRLPNNNSKNKIDVKNKTSLSLIPSIPSCKKWMTNKYMRHENQTKQIEKSDLAVKVFLYLFNYIFCQQGVRCFDNKQIKTIGLVVWSVFQNFITYKRWINILITFKRNP